MTEKNAARPLDGIRVLELTGPHPQPVASGALFTCQVVGEVTAPEPPPHVELGIAIVDAATNQMLSRVSLTELGLHPTGSGRFTTEIALQANVPPGLYRLDTGVWNDKTGIQGPNRVFQVTPSALFSGTHQLNAKATLVG